MSLLRDAFDFFTDGANWTGSSGIVSRARAHMWVSAVATVLAIALAAPVAVWLGHRRRWPVVSVAIANLGRAIPSFAIIVAVLPLSLRFGFGLGFWPTTVALVALGIPPIFTNAYTGIVQVAPELVDAAKGVGMTDSQILRRVEVPAAMPLILNGIRVAAVQIVATATLGAVVGYQCLGSFVIEGIAQPSLERGRLIGGALLIAALAIAVEAVAAGVERAATPWNRPAST